MNSKESKKTKIDRLSEKFGHHFDCVDPDKLIRYIRGGNDYLYATIEDYEKIIEAKVNEAFRAGWYMARTTKYEFDIWADEQSKREE